jgi:hypothetical protein
MKVLFKSFAVAALLLIFAGTGSAPNSGAARETGVGGVGMARAGAGMRDANVAETSPGGDRPRMPGAIRAPHSASAAFGRRETAPDNHGASAPAADQGVTRGGPENPSGLKKPD